MNYGKELIEGVLLKRYKRFFADVEYKNNQYTIHVPNTGSLKGVIDKDIKQKCRFTLHGDESKKLQGTLESVQAANGIWVGVNTSVPNKVVYEAIQNSLKEDKAFFAHWKKYKFFKPEYKISKETRLDGVFAVQEKDLEDEKVKKHFIEIKNTTLMEPVKGKKAALFPDSVTERGQKHLKEMMALIKKGHTAELIFTVQREDTEVFSVATHIDPEYANLLWKAQDLGLIITPVVVRADLKKIELTKTVLKSVKL